MTNRLIEIFLIPIYILQVVFEVNMEEEISISSKLFINYLQQNTIIFCL